nr:putative iron(III) ABC transporter, periplasmic binding protein [uncultured archaeon]
MKTKRFVGIAIVLGLLFFVALPATAIAAEQDDYVLDIYGNANEDDTIDMRDLTYVKLIFFGKKPETELADAKYDGKINPLDFIQIKLIIVGKEKELTVVDAADRTVTLNMPIERIVSSSLPQNIRTICALDAADKIVGIPDALTSDEYLPADRLIAIYMSHLELLELPIAGSPYFGGPYLEVIVSLEPDLVIVSHADADAVQEAVGVPTITFRDIKETALKGFKGLRFMGYVLGEQERAEELISYFNEKIDEVRDITSDISEDEKPEVYLAFWMGLTYTPAVYAPAEVAGGINVAEDPRTYGPLGPLMWHVSKEQIIAWNPDIILVHSFLPAPQHKILKEDILTDPDLQSITAVKNKDVYYTKGYQFGWDPATGVIECFYMGKLFHPAEFADVDVEEVGNEILKEVYGVDGIWTEMTEMFELYTWE